MRLYEHEAKKVFQTMGIPVPRQYGVMHSVRDLEGMDLQFPLMLKAMVLVGGRGKAGGIKKTKSLAEAKSVAEGLLSMKIKGYSVETILVEECLEEKAACYIGATMDPSSFNNVVIVSASGGVDIEEVAKSRPEAIIKEELMGNDVEMPPEVASGLALKLTEGLGDSGLADGLSNIISSLYATYQKYDAKICEVNPLLVTEKGPVAVDAKLVLDDNALYRQAGLFKMLKLSEKRHDVAEPTANEQRAMAAGFPYVDLLQEDAKKNPEKLYVGIVPGGAGYGIFSIDEVANVGRKYFDGKVVPVNFMDSGGGPSQGGVAEMFHLLMDYSIVDVIITSRFGGISSCDVFIRGLIQCLQERREKKQRVLPIHGRMVGTDLPSAHAFLEKAKSDMPEILKDLHMIIGNQKIMAEVIREGLEKAFKARGRSR